MYKHILCWRYLKTRYLAFACIISVMLGVATLIVVNSVMNGFSTKLRTLLHSVLSDVVIEAHSMDGFTDPFGKMARIRKDPYLDGQIEAMAVTLEAFAMLQFRHPNGEVAMRPVRVMGIEMKSRSLVGGFHMNLAKQKNNPAPSFDIPENIRVLYEQAEERLQRDRELDHLFPLPKDKADPLANVPEDLKHLFEVKKGESAMPPPMPVPHRPRLPQGVIVGHLIAHYKYRDPETGQIKEGEAIRPGENIVLTTVRGQDLKPSQDSFG